MDVIVLAHYYARAAHAAVGQRRKYTNEPYIVHPVEVASLVRSVTSDENVIAAALLHDVIEDTKVTPHDLLCVFGLEVVKLVIEVTDVSRPEDGNREVRKAIDRAHLANASPEGQTIKLADLICNTQSIVEHDPKFAKVYLKEKSLLLEVLTRGDKRLYDAAHKTLGDGYLKLKELEQAA